MLTPARFWLLCWKNPRPCETVARSGHTWVPRWKLAESSLPVLSRLPARRPLAATSLRAPRVAVQLCRCISHLGHQARTRGQGHLAASRRVGVGHAPSAGRPLRFRDKAHTLVSSVRSEAPNSPIRLAPLLGLKKCRVLSRRAPSTRGEAAGPGAARLARQFPCVKRLVPVHVERHKPPPGICLSVLRSPCPQPPKQGPRARAAVVVIMDETDQGCLYLRCRHAPTGQSTASGLLSPRKAEYVGPRVYCGSQVSDQHSFTEQAADQQGRLCRLPRRSIALTAFSGKYNHHERVFGDYS